VSVRTFVLSRRWWQHPALRIAGGAVGFRVVSAILAGITNVVFPDYQDQHFTMFATPSVFKRCSISAEICVITSGEISSRLAMRVSTSARSA